MKRLKPIVYRIFPKFPEAHLFEVSCTVPDPNPEGQHFALPAWIPGSYLIRDFAKHVVAIRAASGRRPLFIEKVDKHTWRCDSTAGPVTVTMDVYAWDLSVRGAHLDTSHGFFNGPCVFLRVLGKEERPCQVEILPPRGARYRAWRVATALPRDGAQAHGFGRYAARNYDELIDHPVEMGEFRLVSFRACGVPHDVAVTGRSDADLDRLGRDLQRMCEHHIRFFGEPAPFDRYVFLVTAVGEGYGGLEHRASCALVCARDDLPAPGVKEVTEGYRAFLGLASHEYFHAWNVKRIKPAAFVPYDLNRECYTTLLWAFEGFTSYYDDLALARCGLISRQDYLQQLGRTITQLLRTPGRTKQTVVESSWDAWIKYYRQDENTPNAVVSYYTKGSLIALCLDLLIRDRTRGRKSLDDVMRALWLRHGATGVPVPEDGIERLAEEVTGLKLGAFFDKALRSTGELPLKSLLSRFGVKMVLRPAESSMDKGGKPAAKPAQRVTLGARTAGNSTEVKLTHVLDGGPAQAAGLAAGDTLVAIDGLRVTPSNLESRLARYRPGDTVEVTGFRRDELFTWHLTLAAAPLDTCYLTLDGAARFAGRLKAWLGG
ncbi:MAG: peptidase M61 [Azospira oryzae]|nr:MAG: peptidase M61 [Azospira oryzae]PZP68814.1 MAG: peptidase M61 [Delftia acidovorans]PZP83085.1 MAG: peptidase M61 [Azospira oryzae]